MGCSTPTSVEPSAKCALPLLDKLIVKDSLELYVIRMHSKVHKGKIGVPLYNIK
jgi:hypothetical protein